MKRRLSDAIRRGTVAVATVLALAACAGSGGLSGSAGEAANREHAASGVSSDALKDVTFMLFWAPDTNHAGVYVAKNKGWYEQAGLNVEIVGLSQAGAEQAVNSGLVDFALSTLTNVGLYDAKGATLKGVLQVQQKPSAIWCSLASNSQIRSPKDFDGKTFATFGSSESDAVIRRMIQSDGGKGVFDKVTVGTSTFQTLSSGEADFGGFYDTWEGVQSRMNGPALRCFNEPDYGVPGNADSLSIIANNELIESDPNLVRAFVQATQRGYEYAYSHPDEAAQILVDEAKDANLDLEFVRESMHYIVDGKYWGSVQSPSSRQNNQGDTEDADTGADEDAVFGSTDIQGVQSYLDFLAEAGAFLDSKDNVVPVAPRVTDISTDEFLKRSTIG